MARPQYPSDKQDQFMVRLPAGMRDQLKAEAEQNGRSMNAEIVARLAESFLGVIVTPDELEDVRSKQEEMAEALSKAADRERELLNRVMMLVDAMNKSNESHQRLIELLEAQNVGQKA